jgi:hypothetical protein
MQGQFGHNTTTLQTFKGKKTTMLDGMNRGVTQGTII